MRRSVNISYIPNISDSGVGSSENDNALFGKFYIIIALSVNR